MSHVDDGQLNALLDGELSPEAARAVEAHVATCVECARRLEEARAFLAGAGELLGLLTPPALAGRADSEPHPVAATHAGPVPAEAQGRPAETPKVAKTSREIAVSIDGRTEMTPAIRPVFPHEVPAVKVKRQWNLPDLEKLAWAASLILCLGVGYLANEVYHLRSRARAAGEMDIAQRTVADTTPMRAVRGEPVDPATGSAAARGTPARVPAGAGPAGRRIVAVTPPKPRVTKPAPTVTRPRPEEIGTRQPSLGREARDQLTPAAPSEAPTQPATPRSNRPLAAQPAAPPSSPAPTAQPSPRELADLSGAAGVTAPSPARATSGAGAQSAAPVGRLDEAPPSADRAVRLRGAAPPAPPAPPAFRRVPMEDAVRRLSGSIRLIDGMDPQRVDVGPGSLVPGANPDRDVVRVTYRANGRRLVLDQQLGDTRSGAAFNGLLQGDTLVTPAPNGSTQVRWIDRKFWLSLTGVGEADSVRALVERIR